MNTTQILNDLQIKKSKNTTAHASHLINVYNFLKEIKPNITNVEVLENQPLFFGRKINGVKIIVTTANNGKYSFVCPDKTDYFNNVCELLNLNEQKKEIKKIEGIKVSGKIISDILKAASFTDIKKECFNNVFQNVLIEFESNTVKCVGTTGYYLFNGSKFNIDCELKKEILISGNFNALKQFSKTDYVYFLDSKEYFYINGVEFLKENYSKYPNYKSIYPNYETEMIFNRLDLLKNIKKLLPTLYKETDKIELHLNGNISICAKNEFEGHETNVSMPYISKNFEDINIYFNASYLIKVLKSFNAPELKFKHVGGNNNDKAAVITNNETDVLLMPIRK